MAQEATTRVGEGLVQLVSEFFADPPLMFKILRSQLQNPSKAKKEVMETMFLHLTPWIRNFPRWLGLIYGNCPEEKVRRLLLDNMVDEDTIDKRAGDSHPGLHRRLWKALGRDPKELDEYEKHPIPEISLVINSEYHAARHWPWLDALACVGISEMTTINPQSVDKRFKSEPGMVSTMSALLEQLFHIPHADAAFAWVHESADIGHAGGHLRVLEEYTPPDQENRVIQAARTGLTWLRVYTEAVGREMEKAL